MAVIDDTRKNRKGGNTSAVPVQPQPQVPAGQTQQPQAAGQDIPARPAQPQTSTQPAEETQKTTVQQDSTAAAPTARDGIRKARSVTEIVEELRRPEQLTPEEMEREKKRERAKAIIAAVSDGISAISNLYSATRGAVSTPQISLSEANRKRYDAVLAKRRQQQEEYIDALERAGMADLAQQYKEELERSRQQHEADENAKKRKFERKAGKQKMEFEAEQKEADRKARADAAAAEQEFNAAQKAADRNVEIQRIQEQNKRDQKTATTVFKGIYGEEMPFYMNGKVYPMGDKYLSENAANIVGLITEDLKTDSRFEGLTEEQLIKNKEWAAINTELFMAQNDPKKIPGLMKKYARYSPSAIKAIERLSDYYIARKAEAGLGIEAYTGDDDIIDYVPGKK